jgi:iron-sulfur cluster repair protein YtfE (RIC family)
MPDPVVLLKQDHKEAKALLKQLESSKPGRRREATVAKLDEALRLHMQIEEDLVYPLVAEFVGREDAEEANVEHSLAREGLQKLSELGNEPGFGAAVAMLTAGISHHVKEEEHEIFPELKRSLDHRQLLELGDAVTAAKHSKGARVRVG